MTDALGVDLGVEEGDVDAHEAEEDAAVGEEVGSFLEGCEVERFADGVGRKTLPHEGEGDGGGEEHDEG